MFALRDLPKYEAIRSRAIRYPDADPGAVEAFLVMLRVTSDVFAAFEKYLARYNLSRGTFMVLMLLNRDPKIGLHPSDLATKCGVTRATMSGLLDGLQRKKLIRRDSQQTDRRTVLIRLTDKSIHLLDGMLNAYYRRLALLMSELSTDEKRQLTQMLLKVNDGIRHINSP